MSFLKLRPAQAESQERIEPSPAIPFSPRPQPTSSAPRQIGSVILKSVREITEQAASQMEAVARDLRTAANETAERYEEAARRWRRSGEVADEDMVNFVKVAVTCDDAAEFMRAAIERRNEPQQEPAAQTEAAPVASGVDLSVIEQQIAETQHEVSGPDPRLVTP